MSDYDAIIIGGGPAGSTAASLLAEKCHYPDPDPAMANCAKLPEALDYGRVPALV